MNKLFLGVILLFASGCTFAQPGRYDVSHCPQFGDEMQTCVEQAYDDQRLSSVFLESCTKWEFLEGYEPPAIEDLRRLDRLEIKPVHPLVVLITTLATNPMLGSSATYPGPTGDVERVKIYSLMWRWVYAHELSHISCKEKGMKTKYYTPKQIEMMKNEGVHRWQDTSLYRTEDDTYHWPKVTK